jgi:hypothetical protein
MIFTGFFAQFDRFQRLAALFTTLTRFFRPTSAIGYYPITAIQSISTKTSLGRRATSTQARAGAVVSSKYRA